MSKKSRRSFLQAASGTLAGTAACRWAKGAEGAEEAQAAGARAEEKPQRITMGAIGCGGQGLSLAKSFAKQPGVHLAYICDVDEQRAARAARELEEITQHSPEIVTDMRRILDDQKVDAVTVATPDHWHAPATILACDAGKHVYVEKPCSHNIREGRLMVEAARRNHRAVQVGTQSRSLPHVVAAIEKLRAGAIGTVLIAKAWNSQLRSNIGHETPSEQPDGLDYELWVGPAPMVPYQKNLLHYGWHWWYDFGTGDMGNDGVHELDIARWGLGVQKHPSKVSGAGTKLFFTDDQQFPDSQYMVFDYPAGEGGGPARQLIFEMRIWSPYVQEGFENGDAFYGTDGMMILGKAGGWQIFGKGNKLKESMKAERVDVRHHENFLNAIRTGQDLAADIEIGHLSATLCHLGNICARVGRSLAFDPKGERITGDDQANQLVGRQYREGHWAVPKGAHA